MKTNFQMIMSLEEKYNAMNHTRGVVTMKEIYLINSELCLDEMDELQLRNLRDFVVLAISGKDAMNKISAYTSVIDNKLFNKGYEV